MFNKLKKILLTAVTLLTVHQLQANEFKSLYTVLVKETADKIDIYGSTALNGSKKGYKSYTIVDDSHVYFKNGPSPQSPFLIPVELVSVLYSSNDTVQKLHSVGAITHGGETVKLQSKYKKDSYQITFEPYYHNIYLRCGAQDSAKITLVYNNKKIIQDLILNTYCYHGYFIDHIWIDKKNKFVYINVEGHGVESIKFGKNIIFKIPLNYLLNNPIEDFLPLSKYLQGTKLEFVYGGTGSFGYIPAK